MRRLLLLFGLVVFLPGCSESPATLAHGKPVEHWVQALRDPDARVRKKAVKTLANVGPADAAAIPALIEAVKDRDPTIRREAVLALLRIGPAADAIPTLTQAQNDKDGQVRAYATKAFERIRSGE